MESFLLTQKDIAQIFKVSSWTVWAWRRAGYLPAPIRLGRTLRWREHEILALIYDTTVPEFPFHEDDFNE